MSSLTKKEMEARGGLSTKFVPRQVIIHAGERIKFALQTEHFEFYKNQSHIPDFNYIRFCESTQVPYNTIRSIVSGQRVASIFDLLEVSRFTGFTCDQLLENIPNRRQLHELWRQEEYEIAEKAKAKWSQEQSTHGLFPEE